MNKNSRLITNLTIVVVIGIFILLVLNLLPTSSLPSSPKYLAERDVRGVEVVHKQTPYPLNFDQQRKLIDLLNQSQQIPQTSYPKGSINFEKIVIYRFNAPNIELTPISEMDHELIFNVPEWNRNGLIKDNSKGKLQELISQTFDL